MMDQQLFYDGTGLPLPKTINYGLVAEPHLPYKAFLLS